MSDGTKIEWTDATANVINGCTVLSPGCTNCYAMRLAGTRMKTHPTREGLTIETKAGPVWNGQVRFNETALRQVLSWKKPRRIFWNAHGDMFHDSVPGDWIDRCFAAMALTPQHTHQVLTKRSARMRAYMRDFVNGHRSILVEMSDLGAANTSANILTLYQAETAVARIASPLANVWLGVSAEDQQRWDERVADLVETPAAIRWVSAEPLLGPIDGGTLLSKIDWLVAGGEGGPGARPMDGECVRDLLDQCREASVPFLFKQHGEWIDVRDLRRLPGGAGPGFGRFDHMLFDPKTNSVRIGKKAAGRLLDGVLHDGYPS